VRRRRQRSKFEDTQYQIEDTHQSHRGTAPPQLADFDAFTAGRVNSPIIMGVPIFANQSVSRKSGIG